MSTPALVHGAGCPCVRCKGFQPGHELSVRHGAYSNGLALNERAEAIAEQVRADMPHYAPADEGLVRLLAITEARVERAASAIERADAASENPLAGYLGGDAGQMLERLRSDLGSSIEILDPTLPREGRFMRRWGLQLNVSSEELLAVAAT